MKATTQVNLRCLLQAVQIKSKSYTILYENIWLYVGLDARINKIVLEIKAAMLLAQCVLPHDEICKIQGDGEEWLNGKKNESNNR